MLRKTINLALMVCLSFLILVGLAACGASDSLEGTWQREDGVTEIAFYNDGSCLDLPVTGRTGADAESWALQDDGKLILHMEWDGNTVIERTDDEEQALDDHDYFYLSGDKLIFWRDIYTRE